MELYLSVEMTMLKTNQGRIRARNHSLHIMLVNERGIHKTERRQKFCYTMALWASIYMDHSIVTDFIVTTTMFSFFKLKLCYSL